MKNIRIYITLQIVIYNNIKKQIYGSLDLYIIYSIA